MSWNYWKCRVKLSHSRRSKKYLHNHKHRTGKWVVYVIETGDTISHHKRWDKAIKKALIFQAKMNNTQQNQSIYA